ncbi:MAG: SDR family NAD(P)-dependent oxidoreductase [Firmicutes bacterium]|nr:SDR family NAD(P)-dependent oxidoreductase [Bacillota bacterium]
MAAKQAENFWAGKKVLVTGGASFIGSHLVDRLVECGAHVRVVDDLTSGRLENLAAHLNDGQVEFRQADLREPGVARQAVEGVLDGQVARGEVRRAHEQGRRAEGAPFLAVRRGQARGGEMADHRALPVLADQVDEGLVDRDLLVPHALGDEDAERLGPVGRRRGDRDRRADRPEQVPAFPRRGRARQEEEVRHRDVVAAGGADDREAERVRPHRQRHEERAGAHRHRRSIERARAEGVGDGDRGEQRDARPRRGDDRPPPHAGRVPAGAPRASARSGSTRRS